MNQTTTILFMLFCSPFLAHTLIKRAVEAMNSENKWELLLSFSTFPIIWAAWWNALMYIWMS